MQTSKFADRTVVGCFTGYNSSLNYFCLIFPELWALVNNAGISGNVTKVEWLNVADCEEAIDVNCLGHIRLTLALLPFIERRELFEILTFFMYFYDVSLAFFHRKVGFWKVLYLLLFKHFICIS